MQSRDKRSNSKSLSTKSMMNGKIGSWLRSRFGITNRLSTLSLNKLTSSTAWSARPILLSHRFNKILWPAESGNSLKPYTANHMSAMSGSQSCASCSCWPMGSSKTQMSCRLTRSPSTTKKKRLETTLFLIAWRTSTLILMLLDRVWIILEFSSLINTLRAYAINQ